MDTNETMISNRPYLIRPLNEWIVYSNYLEMQTSEYSQEDREQVTCSRRNLSTYIHVGKAQRAVND